MGSFRRQRVSLFSRVFLSFFVAVYAILPAGLAFGQTTIVQTSNGVQIGNAPSAGSVVQTGNGVQIGNAPNTPNVLDYSQPTSGSIDGGLYSAAVGAGGDPSQYLSNSNPGQNTGAGTKSDGATAAPTTGTDQTGWWIYNVAVSLGGWIAGLGSGIFDGAIYYVVLKMGCWFVSNPPAGTCANTLSSSGAGTIGQGSIGFVVNTLWKVVRDIFNLFFIFSLVYIGIRTILDSDDASAQRAIGSLIIAALLINFSLYITKTIVDVSNYAAVSVYSIAIGGINDSNPYSYGINHVTNSGSVDSSAGTYTSGSQSVPTLSGAYMTELRISSWFNGNPLTVAGQIITFSIVVLIFSVVLGLTLAYGGIMLITRFVTLIILMVFSPAMFLGFILPKFKKYQDVWWTKFLSQAFFAPAYLFMLYLGLFALSQMSQYFSQDYSSAMGSTWSPDTFSIFVFFAVGIGFLVAATHVGKIMGITGAHAAMGAVTGVKNTVIGAGKWGAGRVGTSGLGWGAQKLGEKWDDADARRGGPNRLLGLRTNAYLRGKLKNAESAKLGGTSSYKSRADERDAEKKRIAGKSTKIKFSDAVAAGEGTTTDEKIKFQDTISSATNEQIVDLVKKNKLPDAAYNLLSDSQAKAVMDAENIGEDVKKTFTSKRRETIRTKITGDKTFKANLQKASIGQLAALDLQNDLVLNAMYLQSGQMDELKKRWNENEAYRVLKDARDNQLKARVKDLVGAKEIISTRKNIKEIALLPDDVLNAKDFVPALVDEKKLNADVLRHIASESSIDKRDFGKRILEHYAALNQEVPPDISGFFESGPGASFRPAGYRSPTRTSDKNADQQAAFRARAAAARANKSYPSK